MDAASKSYSAAAVAAAAGTTLRGLNRRLVSSDCPCLLLLLTLLTLTLVPQFRASLHTGGDMDAASKSYSAAAVAAAAGTTLRGLNRGLVSSNHPHLLMLLILLTLTLVPQFRANLRTGGDMDAASKSYSAAAVAAAAGTTLRGLNRGLVSAADCSSTSSARCHRL